MTNASNATGQTAASAKPATLAQQGAAPKQSRIGKRVIEVPSGVTVKVDGTTVTVKGPKGETTRKLPSEIAIVQENSTLKVSPRNGTGKLGTQYQGLGWALLRNMVEGVSTGFKAFLDLHGVGYRADLKGSELTMALGLSHQVKMALPKGITAKVETIDVAGTKRPRIYMESADKELLGQVAARIRAARPPEPYSGKGVRVNGERIREKAGKAGAKK